MKHWCKPWIGKLLCMLMALVLLEPATAQERQLVLVHAKKKKTKTLTAGDRIHYRVAGANESVAGRIDSIGEGMLWVNGQEVAIQDLSLIRKRDGKWKAAFIMGSSLLMTGVVWTQMGIIYTAVGVATGGLLPLVAGLTNYVGGRAMLGLYFYRVYEHGKRLDDGSWQLVPKPLPA
ncbi:MAG: hypothetical protein ACFB10_00010 [Salibacteraceae bacterium]